MLLDNTTASNLFGLVIHAAEKMEKKKSEEEINIEKRKKNA